MKFRNNSGYFIVLSSIILFTFSITCIIHASIVDEESVEALYLFDEGEGDCRHRFFDRMDGTAQ